MAPWIEILSVTYPHEAHLIKSFLESEEIDVILKDELTVQVNNFYSNAVGGIKLCVRQDDAEKARDILTQAGYLKQENESTRNFYNRIEKINSKIPVCKHLNPAITIIVLAAVLLTMPFIILLLLSA